MQKFYILFSLLCNGKTFFLKTFSRYNSNTYAVYINMFTTTIIYPADGVTELQRFIIRSMVNWSKQQIFNPKLISQIFSLLYRQYDEMNEVKLYTLY